MFSTFPVINFCTPIKSKGNKGFIEFTLYTKFPKKQYLKNAGSLRNSRVRCTYKLQIFHQALDKRNLSKIVENKRQNIK